MLRHRAAAAACAGLTVDAAAAAAYCTPEGAAEIRPADGYLPNMAKIQGVSEQFFSHMFFYNNEMQFSRRIQFILPCVLRFVSYEEAQLRPQMRKERMLFRPYHSENFGALAVPRQT